MGLEIRVPEVGESVQEAVLAEWFKADGDPVRQDEALFLLETDKITLEVPAEGRGVLKILVPEGSTVAVGDVVGEISEAEAERVAEAAEDVPPQEAPTEAEPVTPKEQEEEKAPEEAEVKAARPTVPEVEAAPRPQPAPESPSKPGEPEAILSPSVRRLMAEKGLDPARIRGTGPGGRITKGDVIGFLEQEPARSPARPQAAAPAAPSPPAVERPADEPTTRKPLSPIRKRIAERLLEAKHSTAMLTTFNEIDMSRVMDLRARYKKDFENKHGVKLGLMSFFVKASIVALEAFPQVNAFIEGDEIVYHDYYHVGMAIGAERGLVVPVIRHADRMSMADIEHAIVDYVRKVEGNRLQLSDLEGGTFTITNGGVFGSLLSTPILNFPQSAILGLHKIEDRPVVADGEVVVRPMMYVALSYDHRIIDGREAVQFLVRVKAEIEDPDRILLEV